MKNSKSFAISVFLSKKGIHKEDCIKKEKIEEFKAVKIPLKSQIKGDLYLYCRKSPIPHWFEYLSPVIKKEHPLSSPLKPSYSNSGLLVLELQSLSRCAIFSFGYGKSLLRSDFIEPYFGRNVVLNSVDPCKMLAAKSRSYERQPRHKDNQVSACSNLHEFDLNLENEILQRMTGQYDDSFITKEGFNKTTIGRKVSGYHSFGFTTRIPIDRIDPFLKWLFKTFESTKYKKILPDIDSFQPIISQKLTLQLNQLLLNKIKDSNSDGLHLSIPNMLDPMEFLRISIKGPNGRELGQIDSSTVSLDQVQEFLSKAESCNFTDTENWERRFRILCHSEIDPVRNQSFSIFRCITGEIAYNGTTYALMDGDWYEINKNFLDRIIKSLNKYVRKGFARLSAYEDLDTTEFNYNKRQGMESGYEVFDQNVVKLRGKGRVEVCDLLCQSGKLIHVKKYTASSTLSHLFSQGFVSIKALVEDATFRKTFLDKISDQKLRKKMESSLKRRTVPVVFAILIKESSHHKEEKKIENLPAFSIVNLFKFARDIETLGFKPVVQFVFQS